MRAFLLACLIAVAPSAYALPHNCLYPDAHRVMREAIHTLNEKGGGRWMTYVQTLPETIPNPPGRDELSCIVQVKENVEGRTIEFTRGIHVAKLSHGRGYEVWARRNY